MDPHRSSRPSASQRAASSVTVNELATGGFATDQRNVVLNGGTGTGKTHMGIAIARALIRGGTRGRFFNVVDLMKASGA